MQTRPESFVSGTSRDVDGDSLLASFPGVLTGSRLACGEIDARSHFRYLAAGCTDHGELPLARTAAHNAQRRYKDKDQGETMPFARGSTYVHEHFDFSGPVEITNSIKLLT